MTLTKKEISIALRRNLNISVDDSNLFLNNFLYILKNKSKKSIVKIHKFGSFKFKNTPRRIGRNPKTGESYYIERSKRLCFKPNNRLKKIIN